jgi:WhiB family transcriptional regulator, redox-sensing transcriptional regulator
MDLSSLYGQKDVSWMDTAACLNLPNPDIFFPPRDKVLYKQTADKAKEYCLGTAETAPCPVRNKCLLYAIESDETHGIWGGLSHRERNALVRKWQRQYKDSMTLKEYILQSKTKGIK